jgi:hypothetical protein
VIACGASGTICSVFIFIRSVGATSLCSRGDLSFGGEGMSTTLLAVVASGSLVWGYRRTGTTLRNFAAVRVSLSCTAVLIDATYTSLPT